MAGVGPQGLPERIAGFRVLETLGRGGSGIVYLAQDPGLDRRVALKVLAPAFAADPERVDRLRREARLLASLNHPHIAAIYGLVETPDAPLALVLELVEGGTLAARLAQGALPLAEALRLGREMAAGLEAAHEQGVIHRDLKPANVMLTARGAVKLVDFGLARSGPAGTEPDAPTRSLTLEAQGTVFGTPGYMSPEQARGLPLDPRADIFAFGCVLFECLAGKPPFGEAGALEVLARTLEGEPNWALLPGGLPAALRALLAGCLAREAAARPGSMDEIARALIALGEGEAAPAALAASRLPLALTRFIGRERELAELKRLVGFARLVTVTGPGGCGKTRLALELARTLAPAYADGVWLVEFARVGEAERVPQAAAAALGLPEENERPLTATLAEHLRGKACLLVFDNCEHLLAPCAALAHALLAGCPRLKILATSRERFALAGEQDFPLASLTLPAGEDPSRLAQSEALRLFVDRARLVRPDWTLSAEATPVVARICRRLDGIPLAIELAAARVRVLGVEAIEARLDDRFRLLTSAGAPGAGGAALPQHQTLRAALDWSYDLLTADEQRLLRGLAVFAGGWSLELATAVCGEGRDEFELLELLTHFVDKSLVGVASGAGGEARYALLETVREYGLAALEQAGERALRRDAHLDALLALGEQAAPHLKGGQQLRWVRRLAAEQDNLIAALAWAEQAAGGAEKGLRLAAAVWPFWEARSHFTLGRRLLARAIARGREAQGPTPALARALTGAGNLAWAQSDFVEAKACHAESLAVNRALGNRQGEAVGLGSLGLVAMEALALDEATALFSEALGLFRELGDRLGTCRTLGNLAICLRSRGEPEEARRLQLENLAIRRELGDLRGTGLALHNLSVIDLQLEEWDAARGHIAEGLRVFREIGDRLHLATCLERASELAAALGETARAVGLRAVATGLRTAIGSPVPPKAVEERGRFLAAARERLAPVDFERAWAGGEAAIYQDAVAEAIDWLESTG